MGENIFKHIKLNIIKVRERKLDLKGGGVTLNEVIEEAKSVKFGRERGILIIQGGGNNLTQGGAVLQWYNW